MDDDKRRWYGHGLWLVVHMYENGQENEYGNETVNVELNWTVSSDGTYFLI